MDIKYFFVAFMLIMSLGAVSAMDWDNVADYKNEDMTVEITNWLGLGEKLGKATLTSHKTATEVRKVIAGKDRVVMFYEFNFTDIYSKGLGSVTFTDMKKSKSIDRDYSFAIATYKEQTFYSTKEVCGMEFVNDTNQNICRNIKTPYTKQVINSWTKLEKNDIPKGKVTIGLMTDVDGGDYMDAVWEIAGKKVSRHAEWTESLNEGLYAYYTLNETSGTIAYDGLGKHNATGFLTGNWVSGLIGNAYDADGIVKNFTFTTDQLGVDTSGELTIQMWIMTTDSADDNKRLFSTDSVSSGNPGFFTCQFNGDTPYCEIYPSVGSQVAISSGEAPTEDVWTHLVITLNASASIYQDGVLKQSSGMGGPMIGVGGDFKWGSRHCGDYGITTTVLDEVAVWNRSLTTAEVVQLYNAGAGITYVGTFTTPPTITINNPANETNHSATNQVRINWTAEDDVQVDNTTLWLNGVANKTWTHGTSGFLSTEVTWIFPYGKYNLTVSVDDDEGNRVYAPYRIFYVSVVPPIVTLNAPTNDTASKLSIVDFNCSVVDDNQTNNVTLYINGAQEEVLIHGTSATVDLQKNVTLADGNYSWTCVASDDLDFQTWASANFSLVVDSTLPTIDSVSNVTNRRGVSTLDSVWWFNVSDNNLDSCVWHSSDDDANTSVTCNGGKITSTWATDGAKTLTYCVNDSAQNVVCGESKLNITYITAEYSHTPDIIGEGGEVFFELYLNMTDMTASNANLAVNSTDYTPNKLELENYTYYNYTLTVPDGWGNTTGIEIWYNWTYNVTDTVTNSKTTSDNFTAIAISFDNCSTYSIPILDLALKDEITTALISNTTGLEIEVDITLRSFEGDIEWTYSDSISNTDNTSTFDNLSVCMPEGSINFSEYQIDFTLGFTSWERVWEYYYLDNGTLNNTNDWFDGRTNKNINLYDLEDTRSTSFLFNYFDEDGLPVEHSIIHVFRKYIGEGLFREVERARQDENGDTVVHLEEEDAIYFFSITNDGGELTNSSTYNALCQSVPCTIQIEAGGAFADFTIDSALTGGSFNITSSSITRKVNLTFTSVDTKTINLTLYRYNSDGDYVPIESEVVTGTSGEIVIDVPLVVGNKTFFATVYDSGSFVNSEWVSMEEDAGLFFGNSLALFLTFLIVLSLGLMAVSEGGATIIWVLLGLIFTGAFGLLDLKSSAGLGLLIYFVCAGGILVWKLAKRNR